MSKYWAWKLKGTILEEKEEKKKEKGGFLDPWSSLIPEFTREKLSPDIIAIFKDDSVIIGQLEEIEQIEMPFWALLFPKRSYLPPEFPHLQLWYLGKNFAPSFQFVTLKQRKVFKKVVKKITSIYDQMLTTEKKYDQTKLALAINATPFSFIKDEEDKYYAGGQSVRTFHLHFLAVPQNLEKKEMTEKEAVLVYPTQFSHQLLELVLSKSSIQNFLFQNKKIGFKVTERGVSFDLSARIDNLISVIGRLDEIMYQLQLSLIYAFYQDSEAFLKKIGNFARTTDLKKLKEGLAELILLGHERSLPVTKELLNKEIHRFGRKHQTKFSNQEISKVTETLTSDEDGDLASWVGQEKVVLRPGMGYGTMIWVEENNYQINIVPLDSLRSEGTMESNGYYFTEKVKVTKKPQWLEHFLTRLE